MSIGINPVLQILNEDLDRQYHETLQRFIM